MWLRFIFGLLVGSFLNVVALRYREDKFVFNLQVIGGRSHCPHCKRSLRWFELLPLVSFVFQRGRCRTCKAPLSFIYPAVELLSGLIFALAPLYVKPSVVAAVWIFVFLILLLLSLIDVRLRIIPDETNIFLVLAGVLLLILHSPNNFLGPYAVLFGSWGEIGDRLMGAALAGLFFLAVVLLTRGKGMGMGDVKLGAALGFLFGWPAAALVLALSFVLGGAWGISLIVLKKKNRKSTVPFGPFLALGAAGTFFFGEHILRFYFEVLGSIGIQLFG